MNTVIKNKWNRSVIIRWGWALLVVWLGMAVVVALFVSYTAHM